MDFVPLSSIFLATGALAIIFYQLVPSADVLRKRLPNRVTPAALVLVVVLTVVIWLLVRSYSGFALSIRLMTLLFALLFFESLFLLLMRWIRINALALVASLLVAAGVFWVQLTYPSFLLLNSIIVIATLGAATLLIRMGYLRTKLMFVVAALWTLYDIMLVQLILPRVTRETSTPTPTFIFPAVTVGEISLGSGDFMFLTLFTLIILRDFGTLPSIIMVMAEVTGLLVTGLLLPEQGFLVPFLVVMTPIFFIVYTATYFIQRRTHSAIT